MERVNINDEEFILGYHCQEFRIEGILDEPILCNTKDAWLGTGYYFWVDVQFAHFWGKDFKKKNTGYYDIYQASLDIKKCINATFDEKDYYFYKNCIEKTIEHLRTINARITLDKVNRYLKDTFWDKLDIKGIIYDDLPANPHKKPERKYSEIIIPEKKYREYF